MKKLAFIWKKLKLRYKIALLFLALVAIGYSTKIIWLTFAAIGIIIFAVLYVIKEIEEGD